MKVRILQEFRDRADFKKVYPVGETHTFDDELVASLIDRGLVEVAEPVEIVELIDETIEDNEAEAIEVASEQPSEEVVGKVQPIFIHEKEDASATPKKKRSTKDN